MNHPDDNLAARVEALEARSAHQEHTIAELNEVITAQWTKIDGLERLMAMLREEVRNMTPPREGEEPPPPHY